MTDVAARIQTGLANAWATLARAVHGTVERVDGLVVALTEIDDPQLNVALVEHPPMHPDSALAGAQAMFSEHGQRIGIDLARGHHPEVEVAARKLGLVVGVSRPAMAAEVRDLAPMSSPEGVAISELRDTRSLEDFWGIQSVGFGMRPEVVREYLSPSTLGAPGIAFFLARLDGRPVSCSVAIAGARSVGIFGVATLHEARGRGIGTAVTAAAVDWARQEADLAWLQSSEDGLHLYERMGFRVVGDWDVWVEPPEGTTGQPG